MRGVWDLIVACKGSVVVAWRRGRMRTGLAGVLAVAAVVGAVGGLWLVARDDAGDGAAAPIDARATPDRRDGDGRAIGPGGTAPASRPLTSSEGPGSVDAAGAWSAGEFDAERSGTLQPNGDSGTNGSSARTSGTTAAGPNRSGSTGPSIPPTITPAPSVPPDGTATTTTAPVAPPDDGSGAGDSGGLGGLLGGVLEVLGVP